MSWTSAGGPGAAPGRYATGPKGSPQDLFPLPMLDDADYAQRETAMLRRCWHVTNRCLRALNWLAGCRGGTPPLPAEGPSQLQAEVAARVHQRVLLNRPPPMAPTAEGALKQLLKGRSVYEAGAPLTNLASFVIGKVSLPSDTASAPRIESVLPPTCLHISKTTLSA